MKLFVVNVGVNTADESKWGLRSPIFSDDTFELVPILERTHLHGRDGILNYADLPSVTGRAKNLGDFIPDRVRTQSAHNDPEFATFTYGDIMSARAASLARAEPGDQLWFLARLWDRVGNHWTGTSDFFFIGVFQVTHNVVIPAGTTPSQLSTELRERISQNANYRQVAAGDVSRAVRIVVGSTTSSSRFHMALRVTPKVAGHIYAGERGSDGFYRRDGIVLRNKNGNPRTFERLGSITRSVQPFLDSRNSGHPRYIEALAALAAAAMIK